MRPSTLVTAALSALLLAATPIQAQSNADVRSRLHVTDSTELQILTLRGGSTLIGRITVIGADSLTIEATELFSGIFVRSAGFQPFLIACNWVFMPGSPYFCRHFLAQVSSPHHMLDMALA